LVVLSAVVLSIIGVLWGLILAGKSFCIVMCGLGIVALAGIVVSNNIILIDTYQRFIMEGIAQRQAILDSCRRRIRPIILTSMTTTIGLIPMVFNVSIDFVV
jgi:multidrug efflux pump